MKKDIIAITSNGDTEFIIPTLPMANNIGHFICNVVEFFNHNTEKAEDWIRGLDTGDTVGNWTQSFVVCDITDHLQEVINDLNYREPGFF